jgi:hypothetical protein
MDEGQRPSLPKMIAFPLGRVAEPAQNRPSEAAVFTVASSEICPISANFSAQVGEASRFARFKTVQTEAVRLHRSAFVSSS